MIRRLFAGVVLVLVGMGTAQAQSLESLMRGGSGAYYTFADPTDITIQVKVWGAVGSPGLYEVRQGMHLSTLLTLAGGPTTGIQDPRSRRTMTLRLWRPQQGAPHQLLFETQMEDEIFVLDEDPALLNGDMLILEEQVKQRFSWRDGLSILTAVGTVVLLAERIINLGN